MSELPKDLSRLSLAEIAQMAAERRLPPVDHWMPEKTGHSDMRIAADGTWFHEGTPITRENMVRLFSTILRREADGTHVLVTPAEKLVIEVDDTPFLAVEVKSEGTGKDRSLAFRLNTGDLVIAGDEHRFTCAERDGAPRPIIAVRGGMEARIARAPFYALAEWAIEEASSPLGLWSRNIFFPMEAA